MRSAEGRDAEGVVERIDMIMRCEEEISFARTWTAEGRAHLVTLSNILCDSKQTSIVWDGVRVEPAAVYRAALASSAGEGRSRWAALEKR